MKIRITRLKLLALEEGLKEASESRSSRFAYAVARNRKAVGNEIDAITAARNPPDGFKEYNGKRLDLLRKHARKDENGDPVVRNGEMMPEDWEAFDADFGALKDGYKDVLAELDRKEEELQGLLKEEVEIEGYAVKAEHVPDDLNGNVMLQLLPFIDGDIEAVFAERDAKAKAKEAGPGPSRR